MLEHRQHGAHIERSCRKRERPVQALPFGHQPAVIFQRGRLETDAHAFADVGATSRKKRAALPEVVDVEASPAPKNDENDAP